MWGMLGSSGRNGNLGVDSGILALLTGTVSKPVLFLGRNLAIRCFSGNPTVPRIPLHGQERDGYPTDAEERGYSSEYLLVPCPFHLVVFQVNANWCQYMFQPSMALSRYMKDENSALGMAPVPAAIVRVRFGG